MQHMKIAIVRAEGASIPVHSTPGAAGYDLCAHLSKPIMLQPGERRLVPTGIRLAMQPGMFAMLCARSGLAIQHGVTLANGVGILDSDYRGEIQAILVNLGEQAFEVKPGDRIAQLVFMHVLGAFFVPVAELNTTERGKGGFGSTGVQGGAQAHQAKPPIPWSPEREALEPISHD